MIFFNPNSKNVDKGSGKYLPYSNLVNTLNANDLGLIDLLFNLNNNEELVINVVSDVNFIKKLKKTDFFNPQQYNIAKSYINSKLVKYVGNKKNYQLRFSSEDMMKIMQRDINSTSSGLYKNIEIITDLFQQVTNSSQDYGFVVFECFVVNSKKNNKKNYYILPLGQDIINQLQSLISQNIDMGLDSRMMQKQNNEELSEDVKNFLPKDNNKFKNLKKIQAK